LKFFVEKGREKRKKAMQKGAQQHQKEKKGSARAAIQIWWIITKKKSKHEQKIRSRPMVKERRNAHVTILLFVKMRASRSASQSVAKTSKLYPIRAQPSPSLVLGYM